MSSTPLSSSPIQEHSASSHRFIHPNPANVSPHQSLTGHSQVLEMGIGGMGHLHHSLQGSRPATVLQESGYLGNGLSSSTLPSYHQDVTGEDNGSRGSGASGGPYLDVFRQGWQPYMAESSLIDHL